MLFFKKKVTNFITTSVNDREKIYKISYEIFKDSINEIEKTDKKINYYLIILNIFLIIFINFIIKYISFNIDQNNNLNINIIQLLILINITIMAFVFFISLFLCLKSFKFRLINSHPSIEEFDKLLIKTDKNFWYEMYKYYFNKSFENNSIINNKKETVKKIELLLLIIVVLVIILIILIILNKVFGYNSINIKIK